MGLLHMADAIRVSIESLSNLVHARCADRLLPMVFVELGGDERHTASRTCLVVVFLHRPQHLRGCEQGYPEADPSPPNAGEYAQLLNIGAREFRGKGIRIGVFAGNWFVLFCFCKHERIETITGQWQRINVIRKCHNVPLAFLVGM